MSLKMIFAYTLLLNFLLFVWYGVNVKGNEFDISLPKMVESKVDNMPILLVREVDQSVLVEK